MVLSHPTTRGFVADDLELDDEDEVEVVPVSPNYPLRARS